MKQKQVLILGGVLIALVLIAFLSGSFERNASTVSVPSFGIEAEAITEVRLASDDLSLTVQQQGNRWQLTEPLQTLADSITVARFMTTLGDLEPEALVTSNPERHSNFGVDSTGKTLQVTWGTDDLDLIIGNQGPDFQSVYVREQGDDRVLLAQGRLTFPTEVGAWRDKTMFNLMPASVEEASVRTPERVFTVSGSTGTWAITEGADSAVGDSANVVQWLIGFAPIKSDGFLTDISAGVVRDSASHEVNFVLKDGTSHRFWLYERDSDVAAVTSGSEDVYKLFSYRLNNLLPEASTLEKADS